MQTCAKCGGTKFYVCENRQPDHASCNMIYPFHVTAVAFSELGTYRERMAAFPQFREDPPPRLVVGSYETWICGTCGYSEWYAKDFGLLDDLSRCEGSGVRIVQSSHEPYR